MTEGDRLELFRVKHECDYECWMRLKAYGAPTDRWWEEIILPQFEQQNQEKLA